MNNDFPLLKNLKEYGFYNQLSEDELNYVLSNIFQQPVCVVEYSTHVFDYNGNEIYSEEPNGYWIISEYDENNNRTYLGYSDGFWIKRELNEYGNQIYFENSDGYWRKSEYNDNGNEIYWEDSNGYIKDNR